MKRILVTDRAAYVIKSMQNDELMELSCKKSDVADSFGELTKLLISARVEEGSELAASVDGVVKVMETLMNYNELLNDISGTKERPQSYYNVEFPKDKTDSIIPSDEDYKALMQIFESHPEAKESAKNDIDTLTLAEAAKLLGMSEKDLSLAIFNVRHNGKL